MKNTRRLAFLSPVSAAFSALAFLALSLGASPHCRADWKGTLEIQGATGKEGPAQQGKIFAKARKIRFEMSAQGHDMIVIADTKANSASMLMPAQKMAMEMPSSMSDKRMVTCSTDDVEGCLKAKGYKKAGSDTVDGHPCAVYVLDDTQGATKAQQKLWRPTDMKEVFMLKATTTAGGKEITTLVKNIQVGKLDDALFQVPADYKKMQMPDFGAMHH